MGVLLAGPKMVGFTQRRKGAKVLTSGLQIGTSGGYCDDGGEVFDLYGEEFGL